MKFQTNGDLYLAQTLAEIMTYNLNKLIKELQI